MKRTPLQRKTPLRAKKGLSSGSSIKSGGRLRSRSAKTEAAYEERRPLVARLLAERPYCEACRVFAAHDGRVTYEQRAAVDVHEVLTRGRGGPILDESNCMTVCRHPCHERITRNAGGESELLGFMVPAEWAGMDHAEMLHIAKQTRLSWLDGKRQNPITPPWAANP